MKVITTTIKKTMNKISLVFILSCLVFAFTGSVSFAETDMKTYEEGDATNNSIFTLQLFDNAQATEYCEKTGETTIYIYLMSDVDGKTWRLPLDKDKNFTAKFTIPYGKYRVIPDVYVGYFLIEDEFDVAYPEQIRNISFNLYSDFGQGQNYNVYTGENTDMTTGNEDTAYEDTEYAVTGAATDIEGDNTVKKISKEEQEEEGGLSSFFKNMGLNDIIMLVGIVVFLLGMAIRYVTGVNILEKIKNLKG